MNDVEMTGLTACRHRGFGVESALHEQWAFVFAVREPRSPAARERSGAYELTR